MQGVEEIKVGGGGCKGGGVEIKVGGREGGGGGVENTIGFVGQNRLGVVV